MDFRPCKNHCSAAMHPGLKRLWIGFLILLMVFGILLSAKSKWEFLFSKYFLLQVSIYVLYPAFLSFSCWIERRKRIGKGQTVTKTSKLEFFRQIILLVISLIKTLLSRNFCQNCVVRHSVVISEIYSHRKNVSSNHLFSNLFSKHVAFTKFLPKMRESKFPKLPHCAMCTKYIFSVKLHWAKICKFTLIKCKLTNFYVKSL